MNVRLLVKIEGFFVGIAAATMFFSLPFPWWWFVVFFLAPDIAFLGWIVSKEFGTHFYNLTHWYLFPVLLLLWWYLSGNQIALAIALIWFAHIGLDRAIGYGLKYKKSFKITHIQKL